MTGKTSAVSAGDLTVVFNIGNSRTVKLTDSAGKTYVFSKSGAKIEQAAAVEDLYGTGSVTISKIYVTASGSSSADIKGTQATLKEYAGTYYFKVHLATKNDSDEDVTNQGRISIGTHATAADVGAFGASDLAFSVVIANDGTYTYSGLTGTNSNEFFYAITGSDSVTNGSETCYVEVIDA